ncbi:MAG: bifunctional precorrin-2 dehydrogenase/sirohydrochlorin ferrochelatase [Clostridia bacterium]|nr:bifunctional precorrin-2 dehydrogenase/sirohydrochlorin ferrochelatase [Clostridia bacterium]
MSFTYPVTLNVLGKPCVVVGGGRVALRKVCSLLESGAAVTLICPEANEELRLLAEQGSLVWKQKHYQEKELDGYFLVIAATANRAVNSEIAAYCHKHNILVNVADSAAESSFIVNACVRRGDLLLAVSTGGQNPALSQRLKSQLEEQFSPDYAKAVDILNEARTWLKANCAEQAVRERLMQELLEAGIIEMVLAGQIEEARKRVRSWTSTYSASIIRPRR